MKKIPAGAMHIVRLWICALFLCGLFPGWTWAAHFVLVDKRADQGRRSKLYLLERKDGDVSLVGRFDARLGKRRGRKQRLRDRKTPEGKYKVIEVLDTRREGWEYLRFGPYFLRLNYPNRFDRMRRRTGSGIGIHGGRGGKLLHTLGCIRIRDSELKSLVRTGLLRNRMRVLIVPHLKGVADLDRIYRSYREVQLSEAAAGILVDVLDCDISNDGCIASLSGMSRRRYKADGMHAAASSWLRSENRYHPDNLLDGNPHTAWVEGEPDEGVGAYCEVVFSHERVLKGIRLLNGYCKTSDGKDLWVRNNRIRKAVLQFSDGPDLSVLLVDHKGWQRLAFPEPRATRYVRLLIEEIYCGQRHDSDTCLSEIRPLFSGSSGAWQAWNASEKAGKALAEFLREPVAVKVTLLALGTLFCLGGWHCFRVSRFIVGCIAGVSAGLTFVVLLARKYPDLLSDQWAALVAAAFLGALAGILLTRWFLKLLLFSSGFLFGAWMVTHAPWFLAMIQRLDLPIRLSSGIAVASLIVGLGGGVLFLRWEKVFIILVTAGAGAFLLTAASGAPSYSFYGFLLAGTGLQSWISRGRRVKNMRAVEP